MTEEVRTNYSQGYVVEYVKEGHQKCTSWLLLPAENLWSESLRGFLYILALAFLFLGIAIASDVFMCSIEVITSKKRKVLRWDEERQEKVEREVLLWNETVANLTLMALGSSAPEILLATGEVIGEIDQREAKDALGTFTIIGSAAYNLLIITAVCILSVPTGTIKFIKEQWVFIVTSVWSIWAYVWMLLVVKYITPGQIDPWEAWVTLGYLPLFVLMAYVTDRGFLCGKKRVGLENLELGEVEENEVNVRVVGLQRPYFIRSVSKELRVLEAEKAHRMSTIDEDDSGSVISVGGDRSDQHLSMGSFPTVSRKSTLREPKDPQHIARARSSSTQAPLDPQLLSFRSNGSQFHHAAMSAVMGYATFNRLPEKTPRMADVVTKVKMIGDAINRGCSPEAVKQMLRRPSITPFELFHIPEDVSFFVAGNELHKFAFVSDRFAVLASADFLELDVVFYRNLPCVSVIPSGTAADLESRSVDPLTNINPNCTAGNAAASPVERVGKVSVDFETREGSAKPGTDFVFTQGTLEFEETEVLKTLKVPIVQGKDLWKKVDFYIILKSPTGGELGDPSIARITIVDDNDPGEFLFEESHYYANMNTGQASVHVIREHGFNGSVTLDYSTIDGAAMGGSEFKPGVDYIESHGQLLFEHGETSKTLTIPINKSSSTSKNFIIAIRNPSNGAKVGIRSAVVVHLSKDELMERVEDLLEDEEEERITWKGQFIQAMSMAPEKDEEGNDVPPAWNQYLIHFLTFFWKVVCAFIPPTSVCGAWPSFFFSLAYIGAMTSVVEQLGKLLACVVGLETSVAGITIIALGTSLPDTFASRTAAIQDENADAAIGNITGSNSVNVFLGLGLPWVLKTMHAMIFGYTFKVKTDNLAQSVLVFSIAGVICIVTLLIRRKVLGGELGGNRLIVKVLTAGFLFLVWLTYILLSSLTAYGYM